MRKFYENYKRSLLKTISFRLIIMVADFIIIMLITKRYDIALGVLLFSNLSSTVFYFIHERLWNGIHWGKEHKINNR